MRGGAESEERCPECGDSAWHAKHPAAALRGGSWFTGTQAGIFALDLVGAPSRWHGAHGFRCAARGH